MEKRMGGINFIVIDDQEKLKALLGQMLAEDRAVYEVPRRPMQELREEQKKRTASVIHELGIPANIKGYTYLLDAIMICVLSPDAINSITKILYPEVAKKNQTTSTRVERAIRHAIEIAWTRGNHEAAARIFGYTVDMERGKPTNSEFIALIAEKIRMETGSEEAG